MTLPVTQVHPRLGYELPGEEVGGEYAGFAYDSLAIFSLDMGRPPPADVDLAKQTLIIFELAAKVPAGHHLEITRVSTNAAEDLYRVRVECLVGEPRPTPGLAAQARRVRAFAKVPRTRTPATAIRLLWDVRGLYATDVPSGTITVRCEDR